jgi:Xaa-Pro aminopeptidase
MVFIEGGNFTHPVITLVLMCMIALMLEKEQYMDAVLEPGMILTVEPGFYIQADDTLFSPEYRGIGVRIEDDLLVTQSGQKFYQTLFLATQMRLRLIWQRF